MSRDLELAKKLLKDKDLRLALAKDGHILATGERQGISDLLAIVDQLGEELKGAALADKVVGKAVAMVVRLMGIAEVYAQLASHAAQEELTRHDIPLECEHLTPHILNREGKDLCPFEKIALQHQDPRRAVEAFRVCLREMSKGQKP